MQFTVLIEFLVPGLATTLLFLFLLPDGAVPKLPQALPTGETASALLLLAISYPVGILTNFPLFALQRLVFSSNARRSALKKYQEIGVDLVVLVTKKFGITPSNLPTRDREKLSLLFRLISAFVFSKNIERLHSNHIYHEGLQRLGRGILPPLLLASFIIWKYQTPAWYLLTPFCVGLAVSSCFLVRHSVRVEYDQLVRYFLVAADTEQREPVQADTKATGM